MCAMNEGKGDSKVSFCVSKGFTKQQPNSQGRDRTATPNGDECSRDSNMPFTDRRYGQIQATNQDLGLEKRFKVPNS